MAISFHIPSQIARRTMAMTNSTNRGPFILVRWLMVLAVQIN
jgi:hypothetical protein